jgi:hypothetical protein
LPQQHDINWINYFQFLLLTYLYDSICWVAVSVKYKNYRWKCANVQSRIQYYVRMRQNDCRLQLAVSNIFLTAILCLISILSTHIRWFSQLTIDENTKLQYCKMYCICKIRNGQCCVQQTHPIVRVWVGKIYRTCAIITNSSIYNFSPASFKRLLSKLFWLFVNCQWQLTCSSLMGSKLTKNVDFYILYRSQTITLRNAHV